MPSLRVLNLAENFFSRTGIILLAVALMSKGCPKLTHLILDGCEDIGDAGITVLMDALQSKPCPELSALCLRSVRLTDKGIKALGK